jgi:hypothetical protein
MHAGVMVVMVVVMMPLGSERRAGKHNQEERGEEKLFHGSNVARLAKVGKAASCVASKEETGRRGHERAGREVGGKRPT